MHLAEQEQSEINELVAEIEVKSGTQAPVAAIGKADAYPEIPWKAFAVGAALNPDYSYSLYLAIQAV